MARRTATVTITADGRDKGKTFLLTEMAATAGEEWAIRAVSALGQAGVQIPDTFREMGGMATLSAIGISTLARVDPGAATMLLRELMFCVQIVPDPEVPSVVRQINEDDIEEVATRFKLKDEVANLHLGFFPGEKLQILASAVLTFLDWSPIPTSADQ